MRLTLKKLSVPLVLIPLSFSAACQTSLQSGTCGGDMRVTTDDQLADAASCDCVGGSLLIEGSTMASLDAGRGLTCIEGALVIRKNPELVDLSGLLGLERIGSGVIIRDNPVLTGDAIGRLTKALVENGAVDADTEMNAYADDGIGDGPIDDADDDAEEGEAEDDDAEDDLAEDDLGEDDDAEDDDAEDDLGEDDDAEDDLAEDDDALDDGVNDDDEDDDVDVDCEGDPACAEAALDAAVLAFTDALAALVAQIDVAVDLAAQGDDAAAIAAIDEALALVDAAGDAFGDVLGAMVEAFFAGVDNEVLGEAAEAAFGAVSEAEDALIALLEALVDGLILDGALGECGEAGDLLEDLLGEI